MANGANYQNYNMQINRLYFNNQGGHQRVLGKDQSELKGNMEEYYNEESLNKNYVVV